MYECQYHPRGTLDPYGVRLTRTRSFTRFPEILQVLLATLSDNVVVSKQTGKVRDKDRTWDSVKKSLLGNINGFLEELKVWFRGI